MERVVTHLATHSTQQLSIESVMGMASQANDQSEEVVSERSGVEGDEDEGDDGKVGG